MLRIKLVEVENFKSFSSLISLPLESGLNVINGPNGTGKSNLLDAICCAFGCEPKLLRVNNYSDLLNAQGLHVAQQGYAMLHLQSESTRTVLRVEINSKGAIWSIDGRTQSAKEVRDFGRSHGFDYSEGSMGIIRQNFVVRLLDNPRMLSDAIQGANGALRLLDSIRAAQNEAVRLKEAKGGINSALTLLKARIEEEEKKQKRKIRMMEIITLEEQTSQKILEIAYIQTVKDRQSAQEQQQLIAMNLEKEKELHSQAETNLKHQEERRKNRDKRIMEINEVLLRVQAKSNEQEEIIAAIIRDIQAEEEEKEKLKKKIEKIMKELNKKDEQLAEFCLRKQQCEISLAEAEYAAGEQREFYFEASNELKEMQSLIQKEKEKENQKKKENADKKKEVKQIQKDAKEGELMKMRFEAKMEE